METWLVFVHGVQYYLHRGGFEKVRLTDLPCLKTPQMLGLKLDWSAVGEQSHIMVSYLFMNGLYF